MPRVQRLIAPFRIACALVVALVLVRGALPVRASGGMVTDCSSDAQFSSLVATGGTITFNCGTALIHLSSTKLISASTTIDGGGTITLSGDNERQLFVVDTGAVLTLRNIVLTNGFSPGDGGAINHSGTLALENSTIRDSRASASGGAIVSYGELHIDNSLLEGNRAHNGGALYPRFANARTVIVNSVLRNNRTIGTTEGYGGAILAWDGARVEVHHSDIYSNTAQVGGAIYNYANSVLFLDGGTRLRDNVTIYDGGGIFNAGTATLTNVTLNGNSTTNYGGGIDNFSGTATLTNVTLSGNRADFGGGIFNRGTATLTNATLSGNSGILGGGVRNLGTATLTNVTLSGNSAPSGGGILRDYGTVALKNTIVANSPAGGNCSGGVTNSGLNLSSDNTCGFGPEQDNVNVLLGPLADNGGLTQTHLPQAGSPAIDHGSGCPATDQRGAPRPAGAACDIGAVEYGAVVGAPGNVNVYLPLVQK
jgi:hypothetical protein